MTPLLLATMLVFGADAKEAAMPKVEGKWTITYAEEGGRRNNAWEQRVATVEGDTLSYESDGKKRTLKLTFGPHQTVKAKGGDEAKGTFSGVYILSRDYLTISLNPDGGAKERGDSSGSFILILRKQRGK